MARLHKTVWALKKLSMLNTNRLRVIDRLYNNGFFGFEPTTTLKNIEEQKYYFKKLL